MNSCSGAYNDQTGYYDDVFIKGDGTRVSTENKDGKRADVNNIYLYDGGTLYNRKIDTVTVPVSKTWEAAAFQENLQDVKVTFGLQSQDQRAERPGWKYGDACRSVDGSSGRGAVTGRFQCGQCHQKRKQNHAEI